MDPRTVNDRRRARSAVSCSGSSPTTNSDDLLLRVGELENVVKRYKKDVTLRACYHVRFSVRSDMSGRSTIAGHVISAGAACIVDITHAERQKEIDENLAARQHELDVLVRERAVRTQDLDFLGWLERPAPLSILFWDRPSIRVGLTSGKGSDVAFTESFFVFDRI